MGYDRCSAIHGYYQKITGASFVPCNASQNSILNYSFRALQNIDLSVSGEIFAIFDSYAEKPTFAFFADYDSMATAFGENYIGINTRWEDFEDEDLAQWLARLENDFQGIPFGRFDLEDDTE